MKNKKKLLMFGIALAAFGVTLAASSSLKKSLMSQNMADRWSADGSEYSQVSVFFPEGSSASTGDTAESINSFIDSRLKEDSYQSSSEDVSVWTKASASVMTPVQVSVQDEYTGKTNYCQTQQNIMGVSDDFFEFHPLELISGNYIYPGELNRRRAVLDENAAWQIFSSSDVIGMEFQIYNTVFEVAGVVRAEDNKVVSDVYPAFPMIYVHYDILEEIGLDSFLMCYEAVVPDPVSNYAKNIILEFFGINTMAEAEDNSEQESTLSVIIVDNTNRYSVSQLWNNLRTFGMNQAVTKPVAYPYWENAARVTSAWLTLLFFINIMLAAYIVIVMIVFVSKCYLNRKWHLKDYIEKFTDKYTYKKKTSDYINVEKNNDSGKEMKYEEF